MNPQQINTLKEFAVKIRLHTMKEFQTRGFGHVGGALSVVDLLAVLYESGIMRYDATNPAWDGRDRLVCSKGHAGPSLYATLALKGFFPMDWLDTLNIPGTRLPSHCDRTKTPGIDMTTGSLGQGMSTSIGMALADKLRKRPNKVFLIVGDGELNEGQIWEGAQFAAHNKLSNLIAFCDYNHKQLDGYTIDINDPQDIRCKFECFGWHTQQVDGRNVSEIHQAIENALRGPEQPHMIVLDTIKGAGVKEVENMLYNHHIVVTPEMAETALAELTAELHAIQREGASR